MGGRWKWVSCSCLILCYAQITRCEEVKRPSEGVTAGKVENPGLRVARGDSEVTGGRRRKARLANSSELLFVSPNVVSMLPTDQQPLQLLDEAGVVVADVAWSIVDASVAEIVPGEDGECTLLVAKAVGQTRIVATSRGRSAYAEVTVFSSGTHPDGIMRWAAPALPGARQDLSKIVQSLRVDDGTPDLYVGDGVRIRAFNQDGQEKWVWPVAEDSSSVQLLAGDDRGGAVVLATDENDNSIICLDSKGHQAWAYHLAPQFKLSDYAIDRTGLVYLVEDQKQGPSQVVGLEPDTGKPKFIVSVPMSVKGGINWEKRDVRGRTIPVCSLANSVSNRIAGADDVASDHGKLVVSSANFAYLPILVQTVIFDGLPCKPASDRNRPVALDTNTSTLRYSATLQAMQIRDDGTYSLIILDSASYAGPNWTTPMLRFGSSERAIPDGNDDDELLFPSVVVVGSVSSDGPAATSQSEGRIYRFTRKASNHYSIPLLPGSPADADALLIGEHSNAFVMGSLDKVPVVAAFNFNDGTGKWITPAPYPGGAVQVEAVMADDSLIFEYLQDDHSRLMLADPRGNVLPLLPYDLAPLTGSNGPSYWMLSTWFVFLHDQSIARVSRMPS
jgi:outer membrane protein assembly factor BamB